MNDEKHLEVLLKVARDALWELSCLGNGDCIGNSTGNEIAFRAFRAIANIEQPVLVPPALQGVVETVDLFGEKPNGETVLLGKVPIPDRMKAKEFIANYFGRNFSDEDSDAAYALYAFDDFLKWQKEQRVATTTPVLADLTALQKAAPALLAAAKEFLLAYESEPSYGRQVSCGLAIESIRMAITKAGSQP